MVAGRPTENKLLKCYKFNFIRKHAGRALKLHRMAKRRGMGRKTGGAETEQSEKGTGRTKRGAPRKPWKRQHMRDSWRVLTEIRLQSAARTVQAGNPTCSLRIVPDQNLTPQTASKQSPRRGADFRQKPPSSGRNRARNAPCTSAGAETPVERSPSTRWHPVARPISNDRRSQTRPATPNPAPSLDQSGKHDSAAPYSTVPYTWPQACPPIAEFS